MNPRQFFQGLWICRISHLTSHIYSYEIFAFLDLLVTIQPPIYILKTCRKRLRICMSTFSFPRPYYKNYISSKIIYIFLKCWTIIEIAEKKGIVCVKYFLFAWDIKIFQWYKLRTRIFAIPPFFIDFISNYMYTWKLEILRKFIFWMFEKL